MDQGGEESLDSPISPALNACGASLARSCGTCRDALVVWAGHNILLDGHHRYEFCGAHNIPFEVIELELATLEEAVNWAINNQLARRNLTPEAVSYLRGKRYNTEKSAGHGARSGYQNDTQIKTRQRQD